MTSWLKKLIKDTELSFKDKWVISKYYSFSRAFIAFEDVDDEFLTTLIFKLIEEQKPDGGWGYMNESSNLETSFIVISLIHSLRKRKINKKKYFVLIRAQRFLDEENEIPTLD